jgi:hypothetical protein
VPRGHRDGSLQPYSRFSRQEPLLFHQVASQLHSRQRGYIFVHTLLVEFRFPHQNRQVVVASLYFTYDWPERCSEESNVAALRLYLEWTGDSAGASKLCRVPLHYPACAASRQPAGQRNASPFR